MTDASPPPPPSPDNPVRIALAVHRAAWARAQMDADPDNETLGALVDAEQEAAEALIDAPCANELKFIAKLDRYLAQRRAS